MAEPVDENDAWLVDQVARHGSVDGRTRAGRDRLSVTAGTLRDLVLAATRPAGLLVSGLKVLGELDLSYAEIKGSIVITDSEFTGDLDCSNAICVSVDLTDSSFPDLDCGGARIQHDLALIQIRANRVALQDVHVGGNLLLSGANLAGRAGLALDADRVRVAGSLSCGDRFIAAGEVRMLGASVGGQLNVSGGRFINPGGDALSADEIRVSGDVICDDGFRAIGSVRLPGATIGGALSLTGGRFSNRNGNALSADQIRVAGGVFCEDGFRAIGEVRLLRADIGGALSLTGGRFSNPGGDALSADQIRVAGGMFCRNGFRAIGSVRLVGADIGGSLSLIGGRFSNPGGIALSADGAKVAGGVFCNGRFSATGAIRLHEATIGGSLSLIGGRFSNPGGIALAVDRANIGSLFFTKTSNETGGGCSLLGAHIGYLEHSPGAWQKFDKVQLLDLTYDRINYASWTTKQRVEWLRKAGSHENQPYEHLASTLRAQGHEREARKILIAKHTRQWQAQPWYTRLPGLLFGGLLGYGFRPLQRTVPLLLALYLLGAFWLLPQARDAHAVIATRLPVHTTTTALPLPAGQAPQPIVATRHCPADYPCFSPWAYTLDVLVPLVNTHQTDYWTITSKHGDQGAIWYIRLAPALGWILSTAAALGFTGLIRRD